MLRVLKPLCFWLTFVDLIYPSLLLAEVRYQSFDWDNNVFNMPTKLVIYHKETKEEFFVPADLFSILREDQSKKRYGLDMYELGAESFRYFEDDTVNKVNPFLNDIIYSITYEYPQKWKGPMWTSFASALQSEESANRTTIITARKHSPAAIIEGLKYLKTKGLVNNVPPMENIWPVGGPEFIANMKKLCGVDLTTDGSDPKNSVVNKTHVIHCILEQISKSTLPQKLETVSWSFSDDDFKYIEAGLKRIQTELDIGNWEHVRIQLHYTGESSGLNFPHTFIPRANTNVETMYYDLSKSESRGRDFMIKSGSKALTDKYKVNTSNRVKIEEFNRFLGTEVVSDFRDLPEPDSDPITIIRFKASQFDHVLVDDTALDIEDEDIGTNVKWNIDKLENYIGKKAKFVCLLGIRNADTVLVYRGEIMGQIVQPKGVNFGFLPYFLPDGASKTLGEERPDIFNARFYAVQKFLANEPFIVTKPLFKWLGNFQNE